MRKIFLAILLLLAACAPAPATPTPTPVVVKVYATMATQAWQAELFTCAEQRSVVLVVSDPASADISLRIGEPHNLSMPAFQLGWEEIVVVVNRVHPFNQLNTDQVTQLFTGEISDWSQIDATKTGKVDVWVFAQGEDVQQVFSQTLGGKAIVSTARLATSPDEMALAVAGDPNAIGILSRHWKMGNVSDIYVAASAPVLAITPVEPQGAVKDLLACLQK